jgi:hypothetical protein
MPSDGILEEGKTGELRLVVKVERLDRVLYEEVAHWDKCLLSMENASKAHVEMWESGIDNTEDLELALPRIKERLRRLVLALEWNYGRELSVEVITVRAPSFGKVADLTVTDDSIEFESRAHAAVKPRQVPQEMPEVPLGAKRWVAMWTEIMKLGDYVEEQLRRHYLIIEELWDEFQNSFDVAACADKERVKLVRDFVSHASCDNPAVIALVEHDLTSAVIMVNGKKRVAFQRTVEHRNYVSQFEAVSRGLARSLVAMKMQQLGRVTGV